MVSKQTKRTIIRVYVWLRMVPND